MKKTLLKKNILSFGFLVFLFGVFNVSQAQNLWTGTTSNLFMTTTNWTTEPLFNGTDNLRIVATTNNPVLFDNSAATTPLVSVTQLQTSTGTELTTVSDITSTSTSLSVYVGGKLHITGGTFWGKGNIYFGNSTGELPYCNIETGGTLKTKAAILVGRNAPCTIDVNGGTITGESGGGLSIGNYFAAGPGVVNVNSAGLVKLYKVAGFTIGAFGTCNVNVGGKVEFPTGDMVVKGTLNVEGGLVNFLGTAASTINNTATAGTINLNSGSITVGGTLSTINSVINIDSGSLVLAGDQTTAMAAYISANTIKLSPAAVTAGKTLTNTFDSVTGLTTVTAAAPLATDSFEKSDMVKAYPNPTTDTVTVSLPNAAVVQKIAVYNSLGQLVRTEAKDTVSLQNLAKGNYYLTIFTAEGNYSKKIIKK